MFIIFFILVGTKYLLYNIVYSKKYAFLVQINQTIKKKIIDILFNYK